MKSGLDFSDGIQSLRKEYRYLMQHYVLLHEYDIK